MSTEAELVDLVSRHINTTSIGDLAGIEEIATHAARRTRRTRMMGGMASVVVLAMLLVGIGSALREPDPSAVFASQDEITLVPTSVVHVDDAFVGVATTASDYASFERDPQFVIVRSDDALDWQVIQEMQLIEAESAVVTHHDGTFHFLSTQEDDRSDASEPTFVLVHQQTPDLRASTTRVHQLSEQTMRSGRIPRLTSAAANDLGVAVALQSWPELTLPDVELAAIGVQSEDVCAQTVSLTRRSYRLCGSSEWSRMDIEQSPDSHSFDEFLLFAPRGGSFDVAEVPQQEGFMRAPRLGEPYLTSDGFGVSGNPPLETTDFETWTELDTVGDAGPMVVARGDERVFWSMVSVQRFGSDDAQIGMGYSDDAGETWQDIGLEVGALYDPEADRTPVFSVNLDVGPAGWAAVTQVRQRIDTAALGVEFPDGTARADAVLSSEGFQLAVTRPFGPATLTDGDGQVVQEWELLETTRPSFNGLVVTDASVTVVDELTGVDLVTFSAEQWSAMATEAPGQGLAGTRFVYDLLVSVNGLDWSIAHTSAYPIDVLTITDDSVVFGADDGFPFNDLSEGPLDWAPTVRVIPLNE